MSKLLVLNRIILNIYLIHNISQSYLQRPTCSQRLHRYLPQENWGKCICKEWDRLIKITVLSNPKGIRFNKAFIVMIPLQHFLDYELYKKRSTVFYKHVFLCTTAMKIKLKNFSANYKIRQNSKLQFKIFKTIIIQSLNKASKSCDLQNNFFEENRRWRVKYVLTQIRMFCSCLSFYLSPISIVPAKIQRKTAFQSNQFG